MGNWSNEWKWAEKNQTWIKCLDCGKNMETKHMGTHKCKPEDMQNENASEPTQKTFQPANEVSLLEKRLDMFIEIKKGLENRLGHELKGEEHAWASTIFIQMMR